MPNNDTLNRNSSFDVLVLEQLVDHIERLAPRHIEEVAADPGARQQPLALLLRHRLGITLGEQDVACDFLGFAVPRAKRRRVLLRKARDIGNGLFQIAAEDERAAVAMRLTEFVARSDVIHLVAEPEIGEPRRMTDMEMIDRMQVVIEAPFGDFLRAQAAAVLQSPVDEQYVETALRQIRSQDHAVVAGADNDAVVTAIQIACHCQTPRHFARAGIIPRRRRGDKAARRRRRDEGKYYLPRCTRAARLSTRVKNRCKSADVLALW